MGSGGAGETIHHLTFQACGSCFRDAAKTTAGPTAAPKVSWKEEAAFAASQAQLLDEDILLQGLAAQRRKEAGHEDATVEGITGHAQEQAVREVLFASHAVEGNS